MICPTCHRPQLTERPHVHRDTTCYPHRDGLHQHGPDCWGDPDPLHVEAEPVRRPHEGWHPASKPVPVPWAFVIAAFCAGILAGALILTVARSVDAAPRGATERMEPGSGSALAADGASQAQPLLGAPATIAPGRVASAYSARNGAEWPPVAATPSAGASVVPAASGEVGSALLGGFATWFDVGPGYYAAAGPALRAALGPHWRGKVVEVQGPGRFSTVVELVDFCACGDRHGIPTILDLSPAAFRELAPLSAGIVAVSIELAQELPRTDADIAMMLIAEAYR